MVDGKSSKTFIYARDLCQSMETDEEVTKRGHVYDTSLGTFVCTLSRGVQHSFPSEAYAAHVGLTHNSPICARSSPTPRQHKMLLLLQGKIPPCCQLGIKHRLNVVDMLNRK